MSYCKKCGAYIPDGQDTCLACGFDEAAEKKDRKSGSSAAAYAYSPKSDAEQAREEQARLRAEQRRREQQEMNRKWAESEALRRQQQEDFRRSQEEAARRAAEYDAQRTTNEDGYYRIRRAAENTADFVSRAATENRTYAYLSYISFLCFLPSLLGVNDPFTRFHAKQGRKSDPQLDPRAQRHRLARADRSGGHRHPQRFQRRHAGAARHRPHRRAVKNLLNRYRGPERKENAPGRFSSRAAGGLSRPIRRTRL